MAKTKQIGISVTEGGPPITCEQWVAISQKLLDLLSSHFRAKDWQAIQDFIATGRKAWVDLEKQALPEHVRRGGR
jgi:hypothetical protein